MKSRRSEQRAFSPQGIDTALRRAALKARELAERTQTPMFVLKQGKVVDLRQTTLPSAQ